MKELPQLNEVHIGDALEVLRSWPDDFVQCVVTSPPYWGLRDYKIKGQIDLEKSPIEFLDKLVQVFEEVRRVLKPDGVLWLNLGDTYAGSWGNYSGGNRGKGKQRKILKGSAVPNAAYEGMESHRPVSSLKNILVKRKELVGIPWRLALALSAAGWYLRQDIIWEKPSTMPESAKDRCTKSHEYVFMLTKSPRYYFNADAIKEPCESNGSIPVPAGWDDSVGQGGHGTIHKRGRSERSRAAQANFARANQKESLIPGQRMTQKRENRKPTLETEYRNKRSVWKIPAEPFTEKHFATFPQKLVEICVAASSREGDIVLDPFGGSGTTGKRAGEMGRQWLLIELNPEYVDIAHRTRTAQRQLI